MGMVEKRALCTSETLKNVHNDECCFLNGKEHFLILHIRLLKFHSASKALFL